MYRRTVLSETERLTLDPVSLGGHRAVTEGLVEPLDVRRADLAHRPRPEEGDRVRQERRAVCGFRVGFDARLGSTLVGVDPVEGVDPERRPGLGEVRAIGEFGLELRPQRS